MRKLFGLLAIVIASICLLCSSPAFATNIFPIPSGINAIEQMSQQSYTSSEISEEQNNIANDYKSLEGYQTDICLAVECRNCFRYCGDSEVCLRACFSACSETAGEDDDI